MLTQLMGDYPDSLAVLQLHLSDDYEITWNRQRWTFYSGYYIPRVQVDGLTAYIGSGEGTYANLLNAMNLRLAIPTDVTIRLYGEEVRGQTCRITAWLGLEEGASPKTVRVHLVDALFDYPYAADGRYNNCVMQGFDLGSFPLTPGQPTRIEHDITFTDISWGRPNDIRVALFAQEPLAAGPAEVYNAHVMAWPFPIPCRADIDGDLTVNTVDLLALLAAWGNTGGPEDINGDGIVNTVDLLDLLAAWGECPGPPCPWDLNGDGVVDDLDRDLLFSHWGDCPDPPEECPWDINGDGVVDGLDLMELLDHYGPCPEF